jgi:hypothetical protein
MCFVWHKEESRRMTYRGCWIVCRNCSFPIRLPYPWKTSFWPVKTGSILILLACPVCAYVEQYRGADFKAVAFRIPDPFRQEKAALYAVEVACRVPRCSGAARIYAVAARTISVTSLLELWKHWVIHAPCRDHVLRPLRSWTWGVYSVPQVDWRMFDRN